MYAGRDLYTLEVMFAYTGESFMHIRDKCLCMPGEAYTH